jgi:hypothetical protein
MSKIWIFTVELQSNIKNLMSRNSELCNKTMNEFQVNLESWILKYNEFFFVDPFYPQMKFSSVWSNNIVIKLGRLLYWELTLLENVKFSRFTLTFLFAHKIKDICSDSSEFEHHWFKAFFPKKKTNIKTLWYVCEIKSVINNLQ